MADPTKPFNNKTHLNNLIENIFKKGKKNIYLGNSDAFPNLKTVNSLDK